MHYDILESILRPEALINQSSFKVDLEDLWGRALSFKERPLEDYRAVLGGLGVLINGSITVAATHLSGP